MHMSGVWKSLFSLKSRGTVVEHCRKCTVGRRHASPSSWISSLAPRRWRRLSCSVPVVVMARLDPGPPGRSAGVHTRRSRSVWKSRAPRRGGPGSYSYALSAPLGRTRDIIGPLPQREVSPDGRCRQNSNGGGANLPCAALNAYSTATATGVAERRPGSVDGTPVTSTAGVAV